MGRTKHLQVVPQNDSFLEQAHKISRASFSMPVMHRRLIYLAMAFSKVKEDDFEDLEMTVPDIRKALKMNRSSSSNDDIRAAAEGVQKAVLSIDEEDGWVVFSWFHHIRYCKSRDSIQMRLHDELKPYIIDLTENFRRLSVADLSRLQGIYGQRIFELVMADAGHLGQDGNLPGEWFTPLLFDDLRIRFKIPDTLYRGRNGTNDFRRRVIDDPIREINDAGLGIHIKADYDRFRRGRSLLGVRLIVRVVSRFDPKDVTPATASEAEEAADLAKLSDSEQARFAALLREELAQGELDLIPGVTMNAFMQKGAELRAMARLREELAKGKPKAAKKNKGESK